MINCLPGGTVTAVSVPMMDVFAWIPCISNAEVSIAAKKRRYSPLSLVTGPTYVLPLIYGWDIMSHEEDAIVVLASVRTMHMSWDEKFSIALCGGL